MQATRKNCPSMKFVFRTSYMLFESCTVFFLSYLGCFVANASWWQCRKNKTKEKKQMWKTSVNFLNCAAYENSTWRQEVFSCATRYMTCINPNISHNADILVLEISWKNDDTLENEWNFSQAHSFSWKRMNLNISCFFHTCFGRFSRIPMHRDTLIVHLIIVQT